MWSQATLGCGHTPDVKQCAWALVCAARTGALLPPSVPDDEAAFVAAACVALAGRGAWPAETPVAMRGLPMGNDYALGLTYLSAGICDVCGVYGNPAHVPRSADCLAARFGAIARMLAHGDAIATQAGRADVKARCSSALRVAVDDHEFAYVVYCTQARLAGREASVLATLPKVYQQEQATARDFS